MPVDDAVRERRLALDEVMRTRLADRAPPARVVRFVGVGHNLMRYRPAELSAELIGLTEIAAQSQR